MRDQISMLGLPSLNLTAAPLSSFPPPSSCLCHELVVPALPGLLRHFSVAVIVSARSACPSEVLPLGIQMTAASVQSPLSLLLSSVGTFSALEAVVPVAPLFFPIRRRVSLISLCSTGVSRYLAYPLGSPPHADRYYSSALFRARALYICARDALKINQRERRLEVVALITSRESRWWLTVSDVRPLQIHNGRGGVGVFLKL